jgi:hypothetical protein
MAEMRQFHPYIVARRGCEYVRLMLAVALVTGGLAVAPSVGWPAHAVPGACPPICDAIPDSAWVDPSAVPLNPVYRWPGLAGLAVTAPSPRFGFEALCGSPLLAQDARAYAIGARSVVLHQEGQWNLLVQVIHWRGDAATGGPVAGEQVMHEYLLAHPGSSTVVELAMWSSLPARVEWPAVADAQVLDAMAAPLCSAYIRSCR